MAAKYLDAVIEKGIAFILIFTPLAIGTVQQWSIAIMEIASFIILCVWILKMASEGKVVVLRTPVFGILAALLLLIVFQILPLPERLMAFLSPSANNMYSAFLGDDVTMSRTISIYSGATREELFKLLSYAAVFIVVVNHFRTKVQISRVVRTIIYMGCFLAVFAVIQKMTWNGRLYWFYPVGKGLHSDMTYIWGPYINHNHFAGYMEMAIPIGLGFLLYKLSGINSLHGLPVSRRIARYLDRKDSVYVMFLCLAVLIMSVVLFMSLSRGGIIGFTASVLFFSWMIRTRPSLRKKAGVFALLGIITLIIVLLSGWGRIEERFQEAGQIEKMNMIDIWTDTINIVMDFPLFGTGLGTFKNIYPQYQSENSRFLFDHAENDYMEIVTDMGVAGFFIIIGMAFVFSYSVTKAWRKRHDNFIKCIVAGGMSSCVAIAVHSFTDFNLRIPANMMLLTVIAAITYSSVLIPTDKKYSDAI